MLNSPFTSMAHKSRSLSTREPEAERPKPMDTMRSLGDGGHDARLPEAAAVPDSDATPPPAIGTDERRMHVRAYNFWAKLLGDRSFPAIEDLDLEQLGDFGDHAVLLDFTSGIDNPALSFVGGTLVQACELTEEVGYIADVPRRSLLSRLTDHYLQIIANRAPIGFEAEFVNQDGQLIMYRGVLLPFSSDDDTIDFILGVINWKQAAEPALVAAIAQEVEAAAAAATPPRPTMPLWADGPASDHLGEDIDDSDGEDADQSAEPMAHAAVGEGASEIASEPSPAMDSSAWAFDEDVETPIEFDAVDADGSLVDHLAIAREFANAAVSSEARGHKALYDAIGRAWAFASAIPAAEDDYVEILEDAGLKASARSPMTTVARLVFGSNYDKTRIAEVATILRFADREQLTPAALTSHLSGHPGGIKALVKAERQAERPAKPAVDRFANACERLATMPSLATVHGLAETGGAFTVAIIRRSADGRDEVVHVLSDDMAQRVIERAAKA